MVKVNTMKTDMTDAAFKRLMCLGCGFSYDEALGLPEHGLAPERAGRTSPTTGFVQTAVRPRINSK
jgi:rubredoxin